MSSSDYKSVLNQYCQRSGVALPKYSTTRSAASQSTPLFSCSLELFNGQVYESQGTFGNKKGADQNAAEKALLHLGFLPGLLKDGGQLNVSSSMVNNEVFENTSEKETPQNTEDGGIADVNFTSTSLPSTNAADPSVSFSTPPTVDSHSLTPIPTLATSKNKLNERAQKMHVPLPVYETSIDPVALGFISAVIFNGVKYASKGYFRLKKDAEKSAALEALLSLQNQENCTGTSVQATSNQLPQSEGQSGLLKGHPESYNQSSSLNIPPNQQIPVISPLVCSSVQGVFSTPSPQMGTDVNTQSNSPALQFISFKNLLQEYMQQRRKKDIPKYETVGTGDGIFKSTVSFCDKTLECSQGFPNKKDAEQCAAREALLSLGITDPESLAAKRKGKRRWESPLSSRGPTRRKRPRLDGNYTPPKRIKLESAMIENEAGDINFLSVGEVWKEKGNVALVGNNDNSFVLYCTRAQNSLELLNTRTMQNQQLEPGHRLIGLDADVFEFKGKLYLEAERCADVEVPDLPDPVLISCGVVMLHQDLHDSSHVEVLLKRYLVSQAFINVKAALAQFFRRAVIGHPMALPVESLTEHIETWKLEEVVAMATMTASSMKQVFSSLWKFKDRWSKMFEPPLPKELQELQERAQEELLHRNANGINITDLENHPWSLPKGNFRHRMLSTGLHIEKPSECAARELSEETGIQLFDTDLQSVPHIDLPQHDNLNPHKGDVSRYFLYVYKPTMEEQNLGLGGSSAEQMMSNLETSPKDNPEQLTVPSSESESKVDNKNINKVPVQLESSQQCPSDIPTMSVCSRSLDDSTMKHGAVTNKPISILEQDLCTSESSSSPSSSSSVNKTSPLNTEISSNDNAEQREVDESDSNMGPVSTTVSQSADNIGTETENSATPDNTHRLTADNRLQKNEHPEQRGRKRKRSCDEEKCSDSPQTPDMTPPMYQSPSVKGGCHEECAWFTIEEAVKISPVFAEISENQTFMTFLKSLTDNRADIV